MQVELTPWDFVHGVLFSILSFCNAFTSTWHACSVIPLGGLYSVVDNLGFIMPKFFHFLFLFMNYSCWTHVRHLSWYASMVLRNLSEYIYIYLFVEDVSSCSLQPAYMIGTTALSLFGRCLIVASILPIPVWCMRILVLVNACISQCFWIHDFPSMRYHLFCLKIWLYNFV